MGSDLRRVIVVDVEATCWKTREEQGTRPNEIIEIGACELIVKTGEITNLSSILVKPQFTEISPFCTELTGWDQATIDAEGMSITEALAEFETIFKTTDTSVWSSFGEYDYQMLSSRTKKGLAMYKGVITKPEFNPFDYMRTRINVKTLMGLRFKLSRELGMDRALHHIGEKLEGRHHNGADDSYNIAKILRKVLA